MAGNYTRGGQMLDEHKPDIDLAVIICAGVGILSSGV